MVLRSKVMGNVSLLGKTRAAHLFIPAMHRLRISSAQQISLYYGKRNDFSSAEFGRSGLPDCGVKSNQKFALPSGNGKRQGVVYFCLRERIFSRRKIQKQVIAKITKKAGTV